MGTDHAYAELGLTPGASQAEVKQAWRRLASRWHPDRNASSAAIARMQRINDALALIRRVDFADLPSSTPDASAASTASADTGMPPRTLRRKLRLSLEEAAAGCVKTLRGRLVDRCPTCTGAGWRLSGAACGDCHGSGGVRARAWFGWYGEPVACTACSGDGRGRQSCDGCAGSGKLPARSYRIDVRIPHGVRHGDHLQADERRPAGGPPPLRLDLAVELLPHPLIRLDPDGSTWCEVPVDGFQWMANRSIEVPTLCGLRPLQLDREQLSYRLAGLGFPAQRRGPRADHRVRLVPLFPQRLGADQQILLDQLVATSGGPGSSGVPEQLVAWRRSLQAWARSAAAGGT